MYNKRSLKIITGILLFKQCCIYISIFVYLGIWSYGLCNAELNYICNYVNVTNINAISSNY